MRGEQLVLPWLELHEYILKNKVGEVKLPSEYLGFYGEI